MIQNPSSHILKNGLTVILVPCEAESVAFGLFVESGSRHESEKEAGISHFIEHMLFKGTPSRTALDITRAIEGRGGNFNACTGEDTTSYFAHMPSEYLEEAVDIISDMYQNATFPEEEFVKEKEIVLDEIRMYADDPDTVVAENLQRALFPKDSLGRPIAGSEKTLRPLSSEDLRQYKKKHYLPGATVAVVVGAFEPTKALDIVTRALGGLLKGRLPRQQEVNLQVSPEPLKEVSREMINQAYLSLGYRIGKLTDERKLALSLVDGILGRGMASRLFQELREKRGISYDISSRVQMFRDCSTLTISAGMDVAKRDIALKTIDWELKKLRTKAVGAAELQRIKEYMIGNFRLSLERITSKMFFYGNTYLAYRRIIPPSEMIQATRQISPKMILELANELLKESNRSVSWVVPA